jgi:ribonuclease P protein component
MKKKNTITQKQEFTSIIKARHYVNDTTLSFYHFPKKQEENRIGITVTNKLGNAVMRNRAKRQLKEMIANLYDWTESFDTIIIVRENFKDFSFEENKKCLERCYKKVKIEPEGQGKS